MIRLGSPADVENYIAIDDGWLITELHRSGLQPIWKDGEVVYFKKSRKLLKMLKKLDIEEDFD